MPTDPRNTWTAKLVRTLTSVLPVSKRRRGRCVHCGVCCALPNRCPFLRVIEDGTYRCRIYRFRPLNCRKYPRTEAEWVCRDHCGYRFE